ncbi:MAG: NifB/NifX family molybdenum-iron cluster-binding protein [Candidatus Aminicenantales bacterium]
MGKGVDVIIPEGMGPRAQELFAERKIQTMIGSQGRVDEVIDPFIRLELEPGRDLCEHEHDGSRTHPCPENREAGSQLKRR